MTYKERRSGFVKEHATCHSEERLFPMKEGRDPRRNSFTVIPRYSSPRRRREGIRAGIHFTVIPRYEGSAPDVS
jgi:hypothetical protein